jgi:hypothetical protein
MRPSRARVPAAALTGASLHVRFRRDLLRSHRAPAGRLPFIATLARFSRSHRRRGDRRSRATRRRLGRWTGRALAPPGTPPIGEEEVTSSSGSRPALVLRRAWGTGTRIDGCLAAGSGRGRGRCGHREHDCFGPEGVSIAEPDAGDFRSAACSADNGGERPRRTCMPGLSCMFARTGRRALGPRIEGVM